MSSFRIRDQKIRGKALRFFRAEARERWRDLSPEDVQPLNGDHAELIEFLQNRYGLGLNRATREADDFVAWVANRIESACEPTTFVLDIPA